MSSSERSNAGGAFEAASNAWNVQTDGAGNPTPLFCAQAVQLASAIRLLGQQGQHARFRVAQDGVTLNVVAFHQAEQVLALPAEAVVDIVFTPTINIWRDQHTLELHLRALRPHKPLQHGESH